MTNEKKTTMPMISYQLKHIGILIAKVILTLLLLIGIAAIGMMYFPTLGGLDETIRQHWIGLFIWRIILYIVLIFLFFKYFREKLNSKQGVKVIRLFIILAFVVEIANILQIIRG